MRWDDACEMVNALTQSLLTWYHQAKRDLPWRRVRDPYAIWLSEVMLQQTQVTTVIPYYEKFLKLFPSVQALAAAPWEEVAAAWAGLGYYQRARNLQAAAKAIVEEHHGVWPQTKTALMQLKGLGHYTAGAVAAIAFGEPVAAVDGNVARVLSRVYLIESEWPKNRAELEKYAEALQDTQHASDIVQALMELGATICTPRKPRCMLCPWREYCQAFKLGVQEQYPRKATKTKQTDHTANAYILRRTDGVILLQRRPESGLLGGLLGLPSTALRPNESDHQLASAIIEWQELGQVLHVFTHMRLQLNVLAAAAPQNYQVNANEVWLPPDTKLKAQLPTLFRKALACANEWLVDLR